MEIDLINRNMGCIEMLPGNKLGCLREAINRNMGCIEILLRSMMLLHDTKINRNMGCIEISKFFKGLKRKPDKP